MKKWFSLTFCLLFALCIQAQDSLKVIRKKVSYYKNDIHEVKWRFRANFLINQYELEGGILKEEKVSVKSNQLLYRRYYKGHEAIGLWQEYSDKHGLIDIKTSPLPSCEKDTSEKKRSISDSFAVEFEDPIYSDEENNLNRLIVTTVKYPAYAKNKRISGDVFMQFKVDTLGYVKDVCILVGAHPTLNMEAYRAIQYLHRFQYPGMQGNQPREMQLTVPIRFRTN